jgi:hypothetical protein
MNRLALLLSVLAVAPAARAREMTPATTDAQSEEARHLIESNNGAGAKGCLTEKQVYQAYYRVGPAFAWNPDNPVDWYVSRNTIGLFESLVNAGYGEVSRTWNSTFNGTDFRAIGKSCLADKTPRTLAACLNDSVAGYFKEHADIRPSLGGACKMYAATVVAVSSYFPAVTRQASIVASAQHAFNRLTIRDAQGRDHEFLIDALNNLVVQLSDDKGACPDEGTLAPSSSGGSGLTLPDDRQGAVRDADALRRQKAAAERVGGVEGAAP